MEYGCCDLLLHFLFHFFCFFFFLKDGGGVVECIKKNDLMLTLSESSSSYWSVHLSVGVVLYQVLIIVAPVSEPAAYFDIHRQSHF